MDMHMRIDFENPINISVDMGITFEKMDNEYRYNSTKPMPIPSSLAHKPNHPSPPSFNHGLTATGLHHVNIGE